MDSTSNRANGEDTMAAAIGRCAAAMNRTSSCTSWWLTACFVVGAWLQRPAPAAAQDMDYRTLERVKRATVMVFTAASQRKKADKPLGSGSGYFINGTGLLITNNHVVDPAHQMSQREKLEFKAKTGRLSYFVITESGTDAEKSWECELVSQSEAADQALLQAYHRKDTKLTTPDYLRFLPDSKLRKRLKVWVLGFPGGDSQRTQSDRHAEISVSSGMVTDVPRTPAGRVRDVVTDLLARPGNSGGPVVQIDGFVVGTVTLMTQTKERADTSKLVPADLAHQLVRNAYDQGRVAEGSDFTPFTAFLTDGEGRISVPGFKRLEDRDVLFTEAGDRIYGRVADEKIRWESPLGSLEIPTKAVAYTVRSSAGLNLFLEGGDRVAGSRRGSTFAFIDDGGSRVVRTFDEVPVVAFRTTGPAVRSPRGEVTMFESEAGHLVLAGAEGKAVLKSRAGATELALADIARIDPEDGGDRQIVTLTDGRVITGRFQSGTYAVQLAATGTPLHIDLRRVSRATVEVLRIVRGLNLFRALESADAQVLRIAKALERGELKDSQKNITALLGQRNMSRTRKEQLRLLDGVCALRAGDGNAVKKIRKCKRARNEKIAAYARACYAVLKSYGKEHEGKPLSDPAVFADAGAALARELIGQAREVLKDRGLAMGRKGEYFRLMNQIKKQEESLEIAGVFAGPRADDELIRLWNYAAESCLSEYRRLVKVREDTAQGRQRVPRVVYRELVELDKKRSEVVSTWRNYQVKLASRGFHIEDPDVEGFREDGD